MRIAYFDCFSGISGAMALAALVDAGAELEPISDALDSLPSAGFVIEQEPVETHGLAAVRVHVRSTAGGVIRTYASIRALLESASLPAGVRRTSQRAFRLLAEADARVHGREVDLVTFHDVGDIDPIVAIVGTALALDRLGVGRVFASPVPTGMGMARTEHGMVPVPSPVVLSLLQGAPTFSRGIPAELATPVGAAILAAVAEGYGDMPMMRADAVGYGAGALRLDFPHVLRVVVGPEERVQAGARPAQRDRLLMARVDVSAEEAVSLLDGLLSAGARDGWITPAVGPGGDPGAVVYVITPPQMLADVMATLRQLPRRPQVVAVELVEDADAAGPDQQAHDDQDDAG
jgi:uncharacterized protein (TIGR00299 family) protein